MSQIGHVTVGHFVEKFFGSSNISPTDHDTFILGGMVPATFVEHQIVHMKDAKDCVDLFYRIARDLFDGIGVVNNDTIERGIRTSIGERALASREA